MDTDQNTENRAGVLDNPDEPEVKAREPELAYMPNSSYSAFQPPPPNPGYNYYPAPWLPPARRQPRTGLILFGVLFMIFLCVALFGLITASLFGGAFIIEQSRLQTETHSVPVGQAQTAQLNVTMGVGNLKVSGGATDLLNASFTYDLPSWKPQVNSSLDGTLARIAVAQPNRSSFNMSRYEWDLRLKDSFPLNLQVKNGVGNCDLALAGLTLSGLSVKNDVGQATINLSGLQPGNLTATVDNGVGNVTLIVPRTQGVIVHATNGLGKINASNLRVSGDTYTNDSYGQTAQTLTIELKNGVGNINLYQS